MAITARFKVGRVTPWTADTGEVEFVPDYAGGKNAEWSTATPSGVCRLSISNPDAYKQFEQGDSVEILISKLD